jgi:hypothetical protein
LAQPAAAQRLNLGEAMNSPKERKRIERTRPFKKRRTIDDGPLLLVFRTTLIFLRREAQAWCIIGPFLLSTGRTILSGLTTTTMFR